MEANLCNGQLIVQQARISGLHEVLGDSWHLFGNKLCDVFVGFSYLGPAFLTGKFVVQRPLAEDNRRPVKQLLILDLKDIHIGLHLEQGHPVLCLGILPCERGLGIYHGVNPDIHQGRWALEAGGEVYQLTSLALEAVEDGERGLQPFAHLVLVLLEGVLLEQPDAGGGEISKVVLKYLDHHLRRFRNVE